MIIERMLRATHRMALGAVALAAFLLPWSALPAVAQYAGALPRIGFLSATPQPENEAIFWQELRRLGHAQGKDFTVEYRSAHGNVEQLPKLAADLAALRVNVIVAAVPQGSVVTRKSPATIPIVTIGVGDPAGSTPVTGNPRPGATVAGASTVASEVVGKQLELLRELIPGLLRVAILWNPASPVPPEQQLREAKAAAARLRIGLQPIEARAPQDLDRALGAANKERAQALLVLPDPMFVAQARRIADLAASQQIPMAGGPAAFAEAGALVTYGADYAGAYRRAAAHVDRILKGAKPAGPNIEQPPRYELVINAATARKLGVTIPRALIARADRVIR